MTTRFSAARDTADMPKRTLLLSLVSLLVPVASMSLFPDWTRDETGMLVWVLALVPAFLLSYQRGWRGSSIALALAMAAFSVGQALLLYRGGAPPSPQVVTGAIVVLLVVALGSGWLATAFRAMLRDAEQQALTDAGTSLPNRRHATLHMDRAFEAARREIPLSVVAFDLDHFKRVNDTHGHATGDEVLVQFAAILRKRTRKMALSARIGGEEFISILDGVRAEGAQVFAGLILDDLRNHEFPFGRVTASAGIAEYEPGMASPDVLLAAADQALYRAKQAGRDRAMVIGRLGRREKGTEPGVPAAEQPAARDAAAGGLPGAVPGARTAPQDTGAAQARVPSAPAPADRALPRSPARQGRGERILVVDDDATVLGTLSRALHRLGYSVLEANQPEHAVEIIRGLREPVDLVLTDVVMPSMSGFRLVEMLEEQQRGVRVLYMSGYTDADVDWAGVPGEVRGFLQKPIELAVLSDAMRHALDAPVTGRGGNGRPGVATRPARREPRARMPLTLLAATGEARALLEDVLRRAGCSVVLATDAQPVATLRSAARHAFDLIVVEVDGGEEGLGDELRRLVSARHEDPLLPVLVLLRGEPAPDLVTLATQPGVVIRSGSATIRSAEMHVRKLLGIRSMLMEQVHAARQMRAQLTAQEALLDEAHADIVLRLAWAAEYRDDVTGHHAHRVGVLAGLIAGEMGVGEPARGLIAGAAPLHDLGKIAIPDGLLRKPGRLSAEERQQMMAHARLGADVLAGSRHPLLREAEQIARSHHEWWDGSGYPDGLAGDSIPVSARVVAVADVFDSLTHDRPYRSALSREEAVQYIQDARGTQFDPAAVDALRRVIDSGALARVEATDVVAWPDAGGTATSSPG